MTNQPQTAKAIFLEAVENLSAKQWPAFLDQRCGDDQELRHRVEKLLEAHQQAASLFDADPADDQALTIPPANLEGTASVVGPYKLLQQIGEGGMGAVWMAEQEKPVRRRVALKLIRPDMGSKEIIARFEAERQALAMMNHPNIARVLDAGTTETGSPYFVMELVKGIPLNEFCDQNKLSVRERLELFVPICDAIQHAHQKGIIHRDLKPSNVLVILQDGRPLPKVIDFGLAKALEHTQKLTDKTLFTEFGKVVGTVQYMSPEQAEMNVLDVDTRTDIYSLGVMLYELLTGSTPIEKESLHKNALLQVLATIRETDPPLPSVRLSSSGDKATGISQQRKIAPSKLGQILRGELDWVVMKAIARDRSRRYETPSAFADDVSRYLNDEAVVARPPSARYRLTKFARRNKAACTAVVMIAGILIGSTILSLWQASRTFEEKRKVLAEKRRGAQLFSRSDEESGVLALNVGNNAKAIAHFTRALRTNPENKTARFRLLSAVTYGNQNSVISPLPLFETPGDVRIAIVTPDDLKLVAALHDGTIRGWDLLNGNSLFEPIQFGGQIGSLMVSPDSRRLTAASPQGLIRLYDLESGRELREPIEVEIANVPPFLQSEIKDTNLTPAVFFTADSERFVSIHYSFTPEGAKNAEEKADRMRNKLGDNFGRTYWHSFPPDRSMIQVWNAVDGTSTGVRITIEGFVRGYRLAKSGRKLMIYGGGKTVLWDLDTGEPLLTGDFFAETRKKQKGFLFRSQGKFDPGLVTYVDLRSLPGGTRSRIGGPFPPLAAARPFPFWSAGRGSPLRLALKDSMLRYDLDSMAFLENTEDVAADVGPFEIWNIETGQRVPADTTAWKPTPFLNRLRCTLDDRAIVAALVPDRNMSKSPELWDLRTGSPISIPPTLDKPWRSVGNQPRTGFPPSATIDRNDVEPILTADGTLAIYGAHVWEVGSEQELAPELRNIEQIVANPSGDRIIAPLLSGQVSILDRSGTELIRFRSYADRRFQHGWSASPDGRTLLLSNSTYDRDSRPWPFRTSLTAWAIQRRAAVPEIWSLRPIQVDEGKMTTHRPVISGDGRKVVITYHRNAWVWNLDRRDLGARKLRHPAGISAAAFDHTGTRLAVGCADGSVIVWDLATGAPVRPLSKHDQTINALAFNSDGRRLVGFSALGGKEVFRYFDPKKTITWDLETGQQLDVKSIRVEGRSGANVQHLAVQDDGGYITLELIKRNNPGEGTSDEVFISVRDDEGQELPVPDLRLIRASRVAFSADGRTAAISSEDGRVHVWNVSSGKLLCTPIPVGDRCEGIALSASGEMVAIVDSDNKIALWDTRNGEPLLLHLPNPTYPSAISFSRDGTRLNVLDRDQTVRTWHLPDVQAPIEPWFLDLCEAIGGDRFNGDGIREEIPLAERLEACRDAARQNPSASYLKTAHWLVQLDKKRKAAPRARTTTAEYIDELAKQGRGSEIAHALVMEPSSAPLMARRAVDLGATRRGTWLFARALEHDSAEIDASVIAEFATVLLEEKDPPEERSGLGRRYLDLAIERLSDDDLEGWRKVQSAHVLVGDTAAAFAAAQRIVTLSPDSEASWMTLQTVCDEIWKSTDDGNRPTEVTDAILLLHHYADWAITRSRQRAGKPRLFPDFTPNSTIDSERIGALRDRLLADGEYGESEALIERQSEWRYLADDTDALSGSADARFAPDFDATSWSLGQAELGYGQGDEKTILQLEREGSRKPSRIWFRREFEIADVGKLHTASLRLLINNSIFFHVYLNGEPLAYPRGELKHTELPVPVEWLRNGKNVIVVVQSTRTEELSFDLEIRANVPTAAHIVRKNIPDLTAHLALDPEFVSLLRTLN